MKINLNHVLSAIITLSVKMLQERLQGEGVFDTTKNPLKIIDLQGVNFCSLYPGPGSNRHECYLIGF